MDQDGDGNLDPFELHSILIDRGILVPLDVVTGIFNELDVDGDGVLTCDEFTPFMFATKGIIYVNFCKRMWIDWDWWFIIDYFLGGLMYILAAFHAELGISDQAEKDLYLAGIIFYNLGTTRYILPYLYKQYKAEENFEKTAVNIQQDLMENAQNYTSPVAAEEGTQTKSEPTSPTSPKEDSELEPTTETVPQEPTSSPNPNAENSTSTEALEAPVASHSLKEGTKLELYLNEVVFAQVSDGITKTELQLVLIKEVGVIAQSVLDRIFSIVDDDDSGKISAAEFFTFIENWKPEITDRERLLYVFKKSLTNWTYILTLVFLTGGMFIMLENIAVRFDENGLWDHEVVTPGKVGAYCYTIGSVIFVTERLRQQSENFDMEEVVRKMLAKLIKKLDEQEKSNSESKEVEAFNDNIDFDQPRFNDMLEDNNVFMPQFQVKALFLEIDKDGSGTINKEELTVFSTTKRNKMLTILKQSFTNLLLMSYLLWDLGRVVGSAAFIVIATAKDPNVVDVAAKVRGVTYFLGGFFMVVTAIEARLLSVTYRHNMRDAIFSLDKEEKDELYNEMFGDSRDS